MSYDNICVNLYQNSYGEICAFVSYEEDGILHDKLIEGIEKFAKTSEAMFDYISDGFSGFSDYDCLQFQGKGIVCVCDEREEEGYRLIVHFEFNGVSTDYYFERMNEFAKRVFADMKKITDQKANEFGITQF